MELSLQQRCFLYLVNHLENFSPKTLTLLPQRIRLDLLLMLPAADICQLEQTTAIDGIDLEKLWKEVCCRYEENAIPYSSSYTCSARLHSGNAVAEFRRMQRGIPAKSSALSWRDHFANIICTLLLHALPIPSLQPSSIFCKEVGCLNNLILQYLFCIGLVPIKQMKAYGGLPLVLYDRELKIPRRYVLFTDSTQPFYNVLELMAFINEKCHLLPKALVVDCNSFINSAIWSSKPVPISQSLPISQSKLATTTSSLQQFLSQTREIEFHAVCREAPDVTNRRTLLPLSHHSQSQQSVSIITLFLELLVVSPEAHLDSLTLKVQEIQRVHPLRTKHRISDRSGQLLKEIMTAITPLFSENAVETPKYGTSAFPAPIWSCAPYCGLRKFKVATNYKGEGNSANITSTQQFFQLIQSQKHLESIHISGWWEWSDILLSHTLRLDDEMIAAFLFPPHLTDLHLQNLDMPASFIQRLILAFLSSPSTHRQKFTLYSVWMYDETNKTRSKRYKCNSQGIRCKSLQLLSMYISNHFIQWLRTVPSISLNSLELRDLQYDPDMVPGGVLGALGQHPRCEIENVLVSNHTVDCPREGLEFLLKNPSLKSLEITGAKKELLESLTLGLSAAVQSKVSSLQTLSLIATEFSHEIGMSEFEALCNAIFSLPQLSKLSLHISDGCFFNLEHVRIMHDACKKCDKGNQLKKLSFSGQIVDTLKQAAKDLELEHFVQIIEL